MFPLTSFFPSFPSFPSFLSPQPGADGASTLESVASATVLELGLWTPAPDQSTSPDENQTTSMPVSSPAVDADLPPAPVARSDLPREPAISAADRAFWNSLLNISRTVDQVLPGRPVATQGHTVPNTEVSGPDGSGIHHHHDSFPSAASLERLRQMVRRQRLLAARYPIRPLIRPFPAMTAEEIHCDHWDTKGSWSSLDNIATETASGSVKRTKVIIPTIIVTNADGTLPVKSKKNVKTDSNLSAPPGLMRRTKTCRTNTPRNRRAYPTYGAVIWKGPITLRHEEHDYFIPSNAYDKPNNRVDVCDSSLQRADVEILISHTEQAKFFATLYTKQPALKFVDIPVAFVEYPEYSFAIMAIRQKHCPSLGNLIHWIGNAPLTMRQIQRYSSELATALSKLSAVGIVHRDIRPEHIYVTPEGPIALSSFRRATLQHDNSDKLKESFPATGFLAPEMVSARRTKYGYDGTSDVWAFGMVMLDMITGQVNVSKVSADDLERYNLMMPFVVHNLIDTFVDDELASDLLHSILQEDPMRRPTWDTIRNHPFFSA